MAEMDLPLMAVLKESAAERVKGASVNPRSRMKLGTLSVPLETKQGEAGHMGGRLARVYAKLDQSAENQLGRMDELRGLKLALLTCSGEEKVRLESDIHTCELDIKLLGEQVQAYAALVESLVLLEPLGDGRETEKKGDMGLEKSIVLSMDKFSGEIGQDASAHASGVFQVVNTLNMSDTDKKTAFLTTLQGYPLRTMSGVAGDPLVTFVELVVEFRQRYGRGDRDADDALNRVAREDKQGKGESTQLFRDRVHALAHAADKAMNQPTVLRLFIDGLRDERVRQ